MSARHYDAGSVTFFRKRPHILEKADADDPDVRDALLKNAVINSLS